jgi:cytochrome c5
MPLTAMTTKLSPVILAIAGLAVTGAGYALAQALDAATQARVERFEKGPATINVSKYPAGIQANYAVFSQKCSQCHKLSRPINSDYALPDEWSRYIHRMMNKPGSGIGASDGKQIYEFLVYDSSIRKKAMLDQKFSQLSPSEKAAAQAKIKEVTDKYH